MAYPASQGILTYRVQEIDLRAIRVKTATTNLRNASAAGDTLRSDYEQLVYFLTDFVNYLDESQAIPGMGAAVTAEHPNYSGDPVADALTMKNAAATLRDWIVNQVQTTNLYAITPGQTTTFRTNADLFTATIG